MGKKSELLKHLKEYYQVSHCAYLLLPILFNTHLYKTNKAEGTRIKKPSKVKKTAQT